ncbi:MAG: hypothetical protein KDB82_17295 [Planctomycetes bacterium]|nr:hypothetical protein [Planctomycetota bacterium]
MNERMKILEMLKDGKITPEQADKLLDKLAKLDAEPDEDDFVVEEPRAYKATAIAMAMKAKNKTKGKRFLGIHITTHDGKNINVRLPLGIVRAGVKMTALLPESARDALEDKGISLDELVKLHGDDLTQALEELDIKISTDEGDHINIGAED